MNDFWSKLKQGAQRVGDFQARLLLTILYGLLVLPTGLIIKLGGDLLHKRPSGPSYWQPRTTQDTHLRPARRQG